MENATCRICLGENVRMLPIVNTALQCIYEKITGLMFETASRPMLVCYMCHNHLKRTHQLIMKCYQTEKIFIQICNGNHDWQRELLNEQLSNFNSLSMRTVLRINIPSPANNVPPIKEEVSDTDGKDNITTLCDEQALSAASLLETIQSDKWYADVKEEPIDSDEVHFNIKQEREENNFLPESNSVQEELNADQDNSLSDDNDDDDTLLKLETEKLTVRKSEKYRLGITISGINKSMQRHNLDDLPKDLTEKSNLTQQNEPNTNTEVLPANKPNKTTNVIIVNNTLRSHYRKETNNEQSVYNKHKKIENKFWYRHVNCNENPINNKEIFKCDVCNFTCNHGPTFKFHMRIHAGERRYNCNVCKKGFITPRDMYRHELQHTGEKPFECEICNKSFKEQAKLNMHYRVHTGERPYKCNVPLCDRSFTNMSNLKRHIRVHHTKEKPYVCDYCGKTFTEKREMTVHVLKHNNVTIFKCNLCGYGNNKKESFKSHTCRNPATFPFQCKTCYKRFADRNKFEKHSHSLMYGCDICQKTFSSKSGLRSHIISHMGARPFVCDICNSSYSQRGHLNRHIRTHTGANPYKCIRCPKTFSQKASLQRHSLKCKNLY